MKHPLIGLIGLAHSENWGFWGLLGSVFDTCCLWGSGAPLPANFVMLGFGEGMLFEHFLSRFTRLVWSGRWGLR